MMTDQLFHKQEGRLKKWSLLLTIPCAILPMLMASGSLLSPLEEPAYFPYDQIAAVAIYGMYTYGLLLSLQHHRKFLPFTIFVAHLISMSLYHLFLKENWLGYVTVFSLILTSVFNQYYRMEFSECLECGHGIQFPISMSKADSN